MCFRHSCSLPTALAFSFFHIIPKVLVMSQADITRQSAAGETLESSDFAQLLNKEFKRLGNSKFVAMILDYGPQERG